MRAREYVATYAKRQPGGWPGTDALETRLGVRALDADHARELAPIVFEQVFKRRPASVGFELTSLEELPA